MNSTGRNKILTTCTKPLTFIGKLYLHTESASASILRFNGLRTLASDLSLSKLILHIFLLNVSSQLLLPLIFPIFATQQFRRHVQRQIFFTSLYAMRICSELRYRILIDPCQVKHYKIHNENAILTHIGHARAYVFAFSIHQYCSTFSASYRSD